MADLLRDFRVYAALALKVKEPTTAVIMPFHLFPIQQKIDAAIDHELAQGHPARVVILKYRRAKVSTVCAGRAFHRVVTRPNQRCQFTAHRGPDARTIFGIYERFYEHLPERLGGFPMKPRRVGGRSQELVFPGLGSSIEVGSAGSTGLGRGGDLQIFHASELPYYRHPEEFLSGVLPQLSASGDNIATIESTGDSSNDWWEAFWQRAKDGLSGWVPLFFAWHEDPTNRLTPGLDPEDWTDEETELHTLYGVDSEQLAWLRYKLETEAEGSVNRRRQINPSCEADCWVSVGRAPWDSETLMRVYQRTEPKWHGEITSSGIQKSPEGRLTVWEDPAERKECDYVIGVDVAGELEDADHDSCAVTVWRVGKKLGQWPVQVAAWKGNLDSYSYAQMCALLGHYYHKALLAVEINGIGRPVQNMLQKNFYYPRLYRYRRFDAYKVAKDTWGWSTTPQSKDAMLGIADWLIRCQKVVIRDPALLNELMNYRHVGNDHVGMQGDDLIMSAMIAWTVWLQDICAGTPMSDLRKLLAQLYGGTAGVETQARPSRALSVGEMGDDDVDAMLAHVSGARDEWIPSGRRHRPVQEGHF